MKAIDQSENAAALAAMRDWLRARTRDDQLRVWLAVGGTEAEFDAAVDAAAAEAARHEVELVDALRSRGVIGQAQGILMEREQITSEQAFALLRNASMHLNVKLREVARTVVETGESPGPGAKEQPAEQ